MCALGCRVDVKNKFDMTPLHSNIILNVLLYFLIFLKTQLNKNLAATEKNEIDAVRCLCLAGPDLSIANREGKTAEDLALSSRFSNIANLLSSLREVNIC